MAVLNRPQAQLGPEAKQEMLIAASKANSKRQTYQGIDRCAVTCCYINGPSRASSQSLSGASYVILPDVCAYSSVPNVLQILAAGAAGGWWKRSKP